jgi:predicted TIM-barrel fold metal-dependent hydrolase
VPGGERDEITSLPWPYRRIATEEAFSVPEVYEALRGWAATADPAEPDQDFWDFVFTQDTPGLRRVRRQLLDLEDERLEIMDANGVDVQLLSLTAPGVQTFPPAEGAALARLANDRLAELIGKHPRRFAGLAAVAPQDPRAAAAEIDRAVTDLKLNGVIINSHTGSERNFAITTSGMNWAPVLHFCIEAVGADNIMFAIDYPYQTTEGAVRFLDEAEISDEDRRKIYHRNAERIFGIPDCGEP